MSVQIKTITIGVLLLLLLLAVVLKARWGSNQKHSYSKLDATELLRSSFEIIVYENGKLIRQLHTDSLAEQVDDWLAKDGCEGQLDYTTYVPVMVLRNEQLQINFLPKKTIVSIRENKDGNWKQFSRTASDADRQIVEEVKRLLEGGQNKGAQLD